MPEIYRPTIQTVETSMKVSGKQILPNDLIGIFIQEAEHRAIETGVAKSADSAMSASAGDKKQSKKKGKGKSKSNLTCNNCKKIGTCKGELLGTWRRQGGTRAKSENG